VPFAAYGSWDAATRRPCTSTLCVSETMYCMKISRYIFVFVALIFFVSPTFANDNNVCDELKAEVIKTIEKNTFCGQDSECVPAGVGCPFGCSRYVNRQGESEVRDSYVKYTGNECVVCEYKCREPKGPPICQGGQCRAAYR
jgi:hypothetical protein